MSKKQKSKLIYLILILVIGLISAKYFQPEFEQVESSAYTEVNENVPNFSDEDKKVLTQPGYEYYEALDDLGRCRYAEACVGPETMPHEERGSIGMVKPSGWHTVKYDFVDGQYLYNRCHLIAFCLTGENANDHNLITGTRYMNVEGMLPFENMIARYVDQTGNHVMYRVTPDFQGNELLARGVYMMAESVEDNIISFNVYCPNIQPSVAIDYATGDSKLAEGGEK